MGDILGSAPKNKKDNFWWRKSLLLFLQMSGWIGGPVVIGLFLGKWLDKRYQTEPWLFIATSGLAFIVSMVGLVREASIAMREIERESGSERQDKNLKNDHSNNRK